MSTDAISPLRQRMIEDMSARKLNPHTQRSHISSCKRFAAFLKRSPGTATADEIRLFQLHLTETGTGICNRNRIMTGLRFLFRVTLRRLDLDGDLRVLAVSRSYYLTFRVYRQDVLGRPLYALGDGQWQIPALRILLEKIIPERAAMDAFEVEHEFPGIGRRVMLLNARAVFYADHARTTLLLAFEDVTERRAIEREKEELLRRTEELLRQKDVLLRELEHRVANSLQIIASILMLKARTVTSEETRQHLHDAHQRVMALAAVQGHLHGSERHDLIEIGP